MSELLQQREETFREFGQSWDDHEKQLQQGSLEDARALEDQHLVKLQQARESAEATLRTAFKPSSQLLNSRSVQERLVKQRKYVEAHSLKAEIELMETQEQQKYTV